MKFGNLCTLARYGLEVRPSTTGWAEDKYNVQFVKNAKRATGTMTKQSFTYGKKKALKANKFKRAGYKFVGWNTKANGTGKMYKNKTSVKNLTKKQGKTVKLYAQWKKVK